MINKILVAVNMKWIGGVILLIITIILFSIEQPSITMVIGFIVLLIAASVTYYMGIKRALESKD